MDVVGESVEGVAGVVALAAVVVALAGLDHHDVLVEGLAVVAAKLDSDGSGLLWATTPAVHTRATVFGPILLQTGASGVRELHRLHRLLGPVAFLSFLKAGVWGLAAWTDFADPGFLHQFAVAVVVGYSGGGSRAAGLGALGPGCGLNYALKLTDFRLRSECR